MQEIIAEVIAPAHFWVKPPLVLRVEQVSEKIPWEIFRGCLLDAAQTRQQRLFTAWNLHLEGPEKSAEALLSIKHDPEQYRLYVTRSLRCYAWEAYDAGDNVVLSRETIKWVPELVGSINLTQGLGAPELRSELAGLLFQAIVGTSRLPLTSVESPLPAFSLGDLGYFFRPDRPARDAGPMGAWQVLLEEGRYAKQTEREKVKLLELLLRAVPAAELPELARRVAVRWGPLEGSIPALLRTLFNEVALTPYTAFVEHTLAFVQHLVESEALSIEAQIDFLGGLLRRLGRHLTAYDLVKFHHAGANYPDALLLDAVLKNYLALAERRPERFADSRLRRRAMRQGWLLRRLYDGHAVPDVPTSPGENLRLLPAPHGRVPDEQLAQPTRRRRRLYAGDDLSGQLGPNSRRLLRQSIQDLEHPAELRELGMAVFVERPLGVAKAVGEPDQTLLLAAEGFSKTLAGRRLALLQRDPEIGLSDEVANTLWQQLRSLEVPGLPAVELASPRRPVVALVDALRVADDFVFLRTLPRGIADFAEQVDLSSLELFDLQRLFTPAEGGLLVRLAKTSSSDEGLAVFDRALRKRMEMDLNEPTTYACWAGREYPVGGLRVLRIWDSAGREVDFSGSQAVLRGKGLERQRPE
jgi:hypothetical protein